MEILYILVPVSLILVTLAIAVFGWAVKSGQYDDLEGPAHSILFDDDEDMIPVKTKTDNKTKKQADSVAKANSEKPAHKQQTDEPKT